MKFVAAIITAVGCIFFVTVVSGQQKIDTSRSPIAPGVEGIYSDDAFLAELKAMVDSITGKTNFFSVSLGVTNRLFSVRNNNFNFHQLNKRLAITPSVTWFHHSGLGINAVAFLGKPGEDVAFYQYAVSPSYDNFRGKKFVYGLSYAGYIINKKYEAYATPFRHEGFAYVYNRKGFVRTTLSAGYGKGRFNEIGLSDTVISNSPRLIADTSVVSLQDFSIIASFSHAFEWENVFKSGDEISFIPELIVAGGAQQYDVNSKKAIHVSRHHRVIKRSYHTDSIENVGPRFENAAAAVNLFYYRGSFSVSPSYLFCYYFPNSGNQVSHNISLTAGFIF